MFSVIFYFSFCFYLDVTNCK
ncbi:hypothetical protein V12B01_12690 [Vibrio splendidus 12B01]|nr:hypothetical protein V12B01_12690 [Vibrio splendidus 12B01]EAQ54931.1 hypothetical protein MED222_04935 [Vibrio sp. MED222]